ncbi:MAG: RNA polymerase sigma factor [Parasphingorhabdus sp.]|uniref:RNA polymerase sigma factor n=1 Tax=Parasphingorhabdus sp. TaxID=2709688 RepID=UPI003003704A
MSTQIKSSISKNRRLVNEALVESKDRIFHFLLRHTRNEQDAQDVLQDFFVRVLTRADDLQSCEKIRGWLSSILRSVLSDHFRKRTQETKKLNEYATFLELSGPAEEEPETDFPCIQKNLSKLNPNYKKLIERADLRAEDRTKISKDIGLSANTLRVKLHRSRKALGREINIAHESCSTECDLQVICRANAHIAQPATNAGMPLG